MYVNQIFFIGHNKYGQAGIGEDQHNKKYTAKQIIFKTFIKQVSCGNHHSALLTIDGLIYTMGSNIHGTLGLGANENINYAFKPTLVQQLKEVDQIFSGSYHMSALKQGELFTWGKGIDGQLGHGNMKNIFFPTKIQALGSNVQSVSCGMSHTLVIVSTGSSKMNGYGFGNGIYGQLGCGSNRSFNYPVNIKLTNIESLSAGENHSLFISEGKVFGCGDNSYFQVTGFQDPIKNRKCILNPIRLDYFSASLVNYVDCSNLSTVLTPNNKAYVWGGKSKIWPPVALKESQIINIKVASQKLYCITNNNELVTISFSGSAQLQETKQLLLKNSNLLDFDPGQNHLLAVGDIIAQIEEKQEASTLSLWADQSLISSKQTFSQKSLIQKHEKKLPIHKNIEDYFFTKHLKSGKSDESFHNEQSMVQQKVSIFENEQGRPTQSIQFQTSLTSKAQNISSSIEIESKSPFQMNQNPAKNYFNSPFNKQIPTSIEPLPVKIQADTGQNKKYSQTKLQKLVDQMERKTVHLKKKSPIDDSNPKEQKQIVKTPSSHIKKEPENFVLESGQLSIIGTLDQNLRVSNFQEILKSIPLKEIYPENLVENSKSFKQKDKNKSQSRSKPIKNQKEKQNVSQNEQQANSHFQQLNEVIKQNSDSQTIEEIFIQLLKKQRQKIPSQEQSKLICLRQGNKSIKKNNNCHNFKEQRNVLPSTSRFSGLQQEFEQDNEMPKLVPISLIYRTPYNESKMEASKFSNQSNISGKSNFRRNTDLVEISRSNRELRFELRERDLKISQLQEDLSKKQMEVETLYKQLNYFKNLAVTCHQCGAQTILLDPFASI